LKYWKQIFFGLYGEAVEMNEELLCDDSSEMTSRSFHRWLWGGNDVGFVQDR